MPRKVSTLAREEQPINWSRAFFSGMAGSLLMMTLIDTCYMLGFTRFSLEAYLGSLFLLNQYKAQEWTVGFLANLVLGGIFGIFYGYCFEYVFRASDSRLGTTLGLAHSVIAAIAFFPFFSAIHNQLGTGPYQNFGFFGAGLDVVTPILLLLAHCGFGAAMGTFYGPVRTERVRMRYFEPGLNLAPGDPEAIPPTPEPPSRDFSYWSAA